MAGEGKELTWAIGDGGVLKLADVGEGQHSVLVETKLLDFAVAREGGFEEVAEAGGVRRPYVGN